MRTTLVIGAALAFVGFACGAFSSTDDVPGTDADGGDAAANDAGSTSDAPTTTTTDAATEAACASPVIPPGVACGSDSCLPPSFCCTPGGCIDAGGACLGRAVYCDDSADCAAAGKTCQVCCATTESSVVTAAFCAPSCKTTERQLCNPGANDCTGGKTCRASTLDHDACE